VTEQNGWPVSGGFGRLNHTIEKTVAKMVAGKIGVSVKARQFPCRKLKGDYFLLTGPLMGDPESLAFPPSPPVGPSK